MPDGSPAAALTRLAREDSGRVLAILARQFGDLDLADEAVQDALAEAAAHWPTSGVPDNPPGWLMTVARNKAIDRLRRAASAHRRTIQAAPDLLATAGDGQWPAGDAAAGGIEPLIVDDHHIGDEHLRLVLLCCHPALDRDTQVALTLRLVGGLTTAEIAAAYLIPTATVAQRIVRAKKKIRDARIPLSLPASPHERLDAALGVLYLIFNQGYLTRGDNAQPTRAELTAHALRLTRLMTTLVPDSAEAAGLLALELFHTARQESRFDAAGRLILLVDQHRFRWDFATIDKATAVLHGAMSMLHPGPYQLQALIAFHHAKARTAEDTDWRAIVGCYQQLLAMTPSPVVALNHAVAVLMADGPVAGLMLVDRITGLEQYHLFHAARAEMLVRTGDVASARECFRRALLLADNPAEKQHLELRLAECAGG